MKIRFLRSAWQDLNWVLAYYQEFFPQGTENAKESLAKTLRLVRENPQAGEKLKNRNLRTFPVLRTPFRIVYKVTATEIQVARIMDMRSKKNRM